MAKSILYLEDEVELAQEVIEELEELNLKVIHCTDYVMAVLKASQQKFDLLIVDIHLEKGTGDKLIRGIKDTPKHINHRTPVIVASSQVTKELVADIGADIEYALVKPYSLDALVANVSKILAKSRR